MTVEKSIIQSGLPKEVAKAAVVIGIVCWSLGQPLFPYADPEALFVGGFCAATGAAATVVYMGRLASLLGFTIGGILLIIGVYLLGYALTDAMANEDRLNARCSKILHAAIHGAVKRSELQPLLQAFNCDLRH